MSDELGTDLPQVGTPRVKQHVVTDAFEHDVAFRMGFVGLGQGGGRMAETFFNKGYRRVAAINSAHEDLADLSDEITKLDFGTGGAGQDLDAGKRFVVGAEQKIWSTLERAVTDKVDYLLVSVSLGGGTGSGGAAELIKICRRYMQENGRESRRVGVIASLPQEYEGQRTCRNAVAAFRAIEELQPSPFIIVDNRRIESLFAPGSSKFYPQANEQVAGLFHLFNRFACQRSKLITFDRADYATLLDSGIVVFGASAVDKYDNKGDICDVIEKQLAGTVLAEVDLSAGRAAGCLFVGSESILDVVPMEYFGAGFGMFNRILQDGATIFRGVYSSTQIENLRCYTMLSALPKPVARLRALADVGSVTGTGIDDWLQV